MITDELIDHDSALKETCGSDTELFESLNTLGLFLKPQNESEIDTYKAKAKQIEENGGKENAGYAFRILIRLGLQLGHPKLVKEFATKELSISPESTYLNPLMKRFNDAIVIAKKYYELTFAE